MGKKGFTLTEIKITVIIIGILAAIAIPAYTGHMTRVRRSDAITALETVALYEEKLMAMNPATGYATIPNLLAANLGYTDPNADANRNYTIVVTPNGTNTAFVASATPINRQAGDIYVFAIDSAGNRGNFNAGAVVPNITLWNSLK
jgi:type IV pilus assembly protein PilE